MCFPEWGKAEYSLPPMAYRANKNLQQLLNSNLPRKKALREILMDEINPTGTVTHTTIVLINVQKHIQEFYNNLYFHQDCGDNLEALQDFIRDLNVPKVNPTKAIAAETPLTPTDVAETMKIKSANKTPLHHWSFCWL